MIDIDDVDRTERGDGMTGFVLLCCLFIYYFVVSMMLYTVLTCPPHSFFFSHSHQNVRLGFIIMLFVQQCMWCRYHAFLYQQMAL